MSLSGLGGRLSVPRSVRVLEGSLFSCPGIIAAISEPRVRLCGSRITWIHSLGSWVAWIHTVGTRVASIGEAVTLSLPVGDAGVVFGSSRGTAIIGDWTAVAHTIIVVDRAIALRCSRIPVDGRLTLIGDSTIACDWLLVCTRPRLSRCLTSVRNGTTIRRRGLLTYRALACGIRVLSCLALVSDARIVRNRTLIGNGRLVGNRRLTGRARLIGNRRLTGRARLIGNRRLTGRARIVRNRTLIGNRRLTGRMRIARNRTLVGNRRLTGRMRIARSARTVRNWSAFVYRLSFSNRALISAARIVSSVTLVRNRLPVVRNCTGIVLDTSLIGYRTTICCGPPVVVPVSGSIVTGYGTNTCSGPRSSGSTGARCTRSVGRFRVATGVQVGVQLIGLLESTFVLAALFLGQTITFSGVGIQFLRLGGLAFGLGSLHLSIGIGFLSFSLAMLSIRFPCMNLMLGLSGFLTNPCGFLALVLALLGCSLSADRDNDADDNQNYDDRYDYPDDGSCIHALSPCCLFGSH